ncbi:hypothetical protein P43SY_008567 [Pythium insidiosum]|uniref:Uncharacterized protein n=1 Tax=Pythium insidiosum TaxID=114742 RepID=A0AAD5LL18_PYTIN|nr:hypothetical protein P43SY_008567 [Pythium insidiosum]
MWSDTSGEDYTDELYDVTSALENAERPRDWCTSGDLETFPLPGLVVDDVGDIGLPLGEETAKLIARKWRHVEYGSARGSHNAGTRSEPKFLSSKFLTIANPRWNETVMATKVPPCVDDVASNRGLEDSIVEFFSVQYDKRCVQGSAPTTEEQHLVVMLQEKYDDHGLAFNLLTGRDQVLAHCLAQLCKKHSERYGLYLAMVKHESKERLGEPVETFTTIQTPWTKYGTGETFFFSEVAVDPMSEVAPAAYFDSEACDYTSREANGYDVRVFKRAALILVSAKREMELVGTLPIDLSAPRLKSLVVSDKTRAKSLAHAICSRLHKWSSESELFLQCLDAMLTLKDAHLVTKLVKTLPTITFQPEILQAVGLFSWQLCGSELLKYGATLGFRNRVNLICSVVNRASPTDHIRQAVRTMLQPMAHSGKRGRDRFNQQTWREPAFVNNAMPTVEEFARLLGVASRCDLGLVEELLTLENVRLAELAVPAFLSYIKMLRLDSMPPAIKKIASSLRHRLESKIRNHNSYAITDANIDSGCCTDCDTLDEFLRSRRPELRLVIAKARRRHLHRVLQTELPGQIHHETVPSADNTYELVISKLAPATSQLSALRSMTQELSDLPTYPRIMSFCGVAIATS